MVRKILALILMMATVATAMMVQTVIVPPAEITVVTPPEFVSVTNGLISYYPFTGNANDAWDGHNLTVMGALLTNGIDGIVDTAYYFDFVDDYMTNSTFHDLKNQTGVTITAWFQPTANAAYSGVIWGSKKTGEITIRQRADLTKWQTVFATAGEAEYHFVLSDNEYLTTGVWYYVAGVFSNGTSRLFVNAVEQLVGSAGSGTPTFGEMNGGIRTNQIFVGAADTSADDSGANQFYNGRLDEVRIYFTCLTPSQITNNYNARSN